MIEPSEEFKDWLKENFEIDKYELRKGAQTSYRQIHLDLVAQYILDHPQFQKFLNTPLEKFLSKPHNDMARAEAERILSCYYLATRKLDEE